MTTIREARIADDQPVLESFIFGSQQFEGAFEPNRRLDGAVASEYFRRLSGEVAKHGGKILVAEDAGGTVVGWAVVHRAEEEIFVVADERIFAYLSELFVRESARGAGVGRALIAACEEWAKSESLKILMIGVLARNTRARRIYRQAGYEDYALQLRKRLG